MVLWLGDTDLGEYVLFRYNVGASGMNNSGRLERFDELPTYGAEPIIICHHRKTVLGGVSMEFFVVFSAKKRAHGDVQACYKINTLYE